jgi:hypothetical protein
MKAREDLPRIRAVGAGKRRKLILSWRGGAQSVVDLAQLLGEYAVFAPLRLDECLFPKSKPRALGVSRRLWRECEAGSRLLSKTVALAAIGLDAQTEAA